MGGPGSGRRKAVDVEAKAPEAKVRSRTTRVRRVKVKQPTGAEIEVQGAGEAAFYRSQLAKYMSENQFTAVSDLADLDRLLFYELLDFRWSTWLGSGKDYDGQWLSPGLEEQLRRNKTDATKSIAELKKSLGLSREARDASHQSVAEYIRTLQRRAKEFGVMRNEQIVQAITLAKELKSIVLTFDRSNEVEQRTVGFESEEDIVNWVRDVFIPKFEAIDERFREQQKLWVGTL